MTKRYRNNRYLFHSFPRPREGETKDETLERGLSILKAIKAIGLVLAPEIVDWDINYITKGKEELTLLQRRASFTELSESELLSHTNIFGPITLACDITALREAGAIPVIYVPQGLASSALSQIGTFCVRGAYHTRHVLQLLQHLREMSDQEIMHTQLGMPIDPHYKLNLTNVDGAGNTVSYHETTAFEVRQILQYIQYNNIPFDHSIGLMNIFINMFYPTDNKHVCNMLGYYRQREWRLIAGDIHFNSHSLGRPLTQAECTTLRTIDPVFWDRDVAVDGKSYRRHELALVYEPIQNFNFFDLVNHVIVPRQAIHHAKSLISDKLVRRLESI